MKAKRHVMHEEEPQKWQEPQKYFLSENDYTQHGMVKCTLKAHQSGESRYTCTFPVTKNNKAYNKGGERHERAERYLLQ